jgi:3-dehydroquinate dehydratase/shikimate dehydrogenase
MATLLCVPILFDDPARALDDARAAKDAGADLVEFRVDAFFSGNEGPDSGDELEAIERLVRESPLPCIVTCRPVLEGGHYRGTESARAALLERLASGDSPPAYIDVELLAYQGSAPLREKTDEAARRSTLILSTHDFHTRPPDLIRRVEGMLRAEACRVAKVAYRARSLRDNLELLDLVAELRASEAIGGPGKPLIALGMGPFGLMSRVLAPKFEAFLTFASLRREAQTAPGQPVIGELLDLYRFRSISPTTKVYGVVGYPVEHSLSPLIHNAGFDAAPHDGVYLPMPVPPEYEHFKATMLAMIEHPQLDLAGCSVTIPHKEHLVRLAREALDEGDDRWTLDDLSAACDAANTLRIRRDPRGGATSMLVANTDGAGIVGPLRDALGLLEGQRVLVLGAGGTARSASAALALAGAEVSILNRTLDKGEALASMLRTRTGRRVRAVSADEAGAIATRAIVHCTPLGMRGTEHAERSPISPDQLRELARVSRAAYASELVVMDCVYNPLQTPLLGHARDLGLRTIDGLRLFVAQAADQFRLWTGLPAPSAMFDRLARETLMQRE